MADDPKLPETNAPSSKEQGAATPPASSGLRVLGRMLLALVVLVAIVFAAAVWYASTPEFEGRVRQRLVSTLENATGGRVELGALHWRVLHLEVEADDLTIHGLEAPGEMPYAHVDRLYVRAKIITFLRTKIGLNYLEADAPQVHLIVYPDGSTNQPHPKVKSTSNKHVMDTIFDLDVDEAEIRNGLAVVNQRSMPLNLSANNLGVVVKYVPASVAQATTDRYDATIHIEDLAAQHARNQAVHSILDAQASLKRSSLALSSLHLQTGKDALDASGTLANFSQPQWSGNLKGTADVRTVQAIAQLPGLERGLVNLQLAAHGSGSGFDVDGQADVREGAYGIGSVHVVGAVARTKIHFTQDDLELPDLYAKLPSGGTVAGSVSIVNWHAPSVPAREVLTAKRAGAVSQGNLLKASIRADVRGMSLASVMEVVSPPGYRDLGFNTVANGKASVDWVGNAENLVADAKVVLTPSSRAPQNMVPMNGVVDAAYHNADGSVHIRSLAVQTPGMHLNVNGALGVYPIERASQMNVDLKTSNLGEFDRTLTTLGFAANGKKGVNAIPIALHGQAEFQGTVTRGILTPDVKGHVQATNLDLVYTQSPQAPAAAANVETVSNIVTAPSTKTVHLDSIDAQAEYAPDLVAVDQALLVQGGTQLHLSGSLHAHELARHRTAFDDESEIQLNASLQKASVADLLTMAGQSFPVTGTVDLNAQVNGQLNNLSGGGHLAVQSGTLEGEPYRSLNTDLHFAGREIDLEHLLFLQDGGKVTGSGGYNMQSEAYHLNVQGSGFDLGHIQRLKSEKYPLAGALNFEAQGSGTIKDPSLQAKLHLTGLNLANAATGSVEADAHTQGHALLMDVKAQMTNVSFEMKGQTQLTDDFQTKAQLTLTSLDVDPILETFNVRGVKAHSSISGKVDISGPLKTPRKLSGDATVQQLSLSLGGIPLKSDGNIHATLIAGELHLDPMRIVGDDTNIRAQGSAVLFGGEHDLDGHADGSINMKLAQTVDTDITSSGHVDFNVDASGTFQKPGLQGQVKFTNVNMALEDFPNGLSQMNGTLAFDQDRLDVKDLTAVSGGGQLKLGGFVAYQQGLYGDLTATAKDVRIRYPQGVSSMADAKLRLQGTQNSMLLSGNVTVTRFAINSDLDFASFNSTSGSVTLPPDPNAPSSHLRLDIHVVSAPELDFQNSYAKLAGDINLRVRGTVAQPSVLGHITVTEGTATFAGTKYELQHGDIYFANPVRIEPTIDLSATAHVEDYDITIGLNGTSAKLTPTFRSEPPLSEQDIFALLAMGRTQEEQQIYSNEQQVAGVNSTADTLLGGALNATVSSRIQKLFGGGSVKIDPTFVTGTGNSTARITVEQQISKNATLTYATNVNSTAQQLIQGQLNITQNVSLLAVRDESGVFSLVFKIRRRYR
ncbi:translocation/assembly module TamB domain-containing protein [Silvibacterium acidisoli]|uniref:translocation/assembly module TamB domain-containing protein n=1 Tax=Acidobacteriaceae bacterium ZG23-2 TaxID=2883246 RepID=UPI00406C3782